MPFGGGLGGDHDVELAGGHGVDQGARVGGAGDRVGREHRQPGPRKQAARLFLHPLDARTDGDQRVLGLAMRAELRLGHGKPGQMADQTPGVAMLDQPGIAVRRAHPLAAGPAENQRGVTTAVEEQQRLLTARQGLADGLDQNRRQPAAGGRRRGAQIDQADVRHARRAVPVGKAQPLVATGLGIEQGLQRRRRRGEDDRAVLDLGPGHGQIAGVIDEAVFLFVRAVVLLIDHNQGQASKRQKKRRARADHNARLARGDALPGLAAPGRGDGRMPLSRRGPEAHREAVDHRLGQGDFRQEHQNLGLGIEGQGARRRLHIDFGLARTGDTVEQGHSESVFADQGPQRLGRGGLARIEVGAGTVEVRRRPLGARRNPHLAEGAVAEQSLDHAG